jgi:hypothetical protein
VKSSFEKLAAHMTNEPRAHHGSDIDVQGALNAGVWRCPVDGCRKWLATVGKRSAMAGHLSKGDEAHRQALAEEPGGRNGWVRHLQQQAQPGSPAHYYNTVHYQDNSSRDARARGWQRYDAEVQQHRQRQREAEARMLEAGGGQESSEEEDAPRMIGGATAREWGLRPRTPGTDIDSPAVVYSLAWLDDMDSALLASIGVMPARMCELHHKKDYLNMLHFGYAYAARHGSSADAVRGFKFNLLAKLVTVGIEGGPRRRDTVEELGLIRMVMAGHLQELVECMLQRVGRANQEEVERALREAAEREAEARLAAAVAERQQAQPAVAEALAQELADGDKEESQGKGEHGTQGDKGVAASGRPSTAAHDKLLRRVLRLINAGYLSKGYAQFSASPIVDTQQTKFRQLLREKHPQTEVEGVQGLTEEDVKDEPGVTAMVTTREAFNYIFARPPMARAMAADGVAYEELGALYHGGERFRVTLYQLVKRINAGELHEAVADFLGDLHLLGLDKPGAKVDVRPIGIPAAIRRMANRVLMHQRGAEMGKMLSGTRVPPELLVAAGYAADTLCNVPLQLGVGLPGGAEIIIAAARAHLAQHPGHAICSDDKGNGFNRISRKAIFAGLRRWFPDLIPAVRLWYRHPRRLFVRSSNSSSGSDGGGGSSGSGNRGNGGGGSGGGKDGGGGGVTIGGWEEAVDEQGNVYCSAEGCAQGDALGPFLWSIGYHWSLLQMQAAHPTALIMAYLDDTYTLDEPLESYACMLTGATVTEREAGVASNVGKQEVYSPSGDLTSLPGTLRGSPHAPPQPEKGYAGGQLPCIRVLGAYLGEDDACSQALVHRVETHLQPLRKAIGLHDVGKMTTSLQVQLSILRFCANTQLTYFLRTMPPSVTIDAARKHDEIIEETWHAMLRTTSASQRERGLAFRQARLPVDMGGMGITSMEEIRDAAWVGSWALTWPMLRQLHAPFQEVLIAAPSTEGFEQTRDFTELQRCHGGLLARHRRVQRIYREYDNEIKEYTRRGDEDFQFHPAGLTPSEELLPLTAFEMEHEYHKHAQKRWATAVHHDNWRKLWNEMVAAGGREAVRLVAVSQPYAGAFLNAVPSRHWFRIPTPELRMALRRRLGLPIDDAAVRLASTKGRAYDAYGDVAQNDGRQGHAHRHSTLLQEVVRIARSVWGARVQIEPDDYLPYSTYRPDMAVPYAGESGSTYLGELKFIDPLSSNPADIQRRGAYIAFGNTEPPMLEKVFGLEERGAEGDGVFKAATGEGYVAGKEGDYSKAMGEGCDVHLLLFETFGGFGRGVMHLLRRLGDEVRNRLSHAQYDQTSWSARNWKTYQTQRLSVALARAAAGEILEELRNAAAWAVDPADRKAA